MFSIPPLLAACYAFLIMLQAGSSETPQMLSPTNAIRNI